MRLCHRAGHTVPLLTLFLIFAGCATSTVPQPDNFTQNPQVVAIYAVDSAFGTLPDVLIFSSSAADSGKVSAAPPPSYGSYRVEFDQPINGDTVANNANRSTGPNPGGAASFCSPLANTPVQLLDLQGDADRAAGPVTASICYDATSALGSHPHITVIPGRTALVDATAKPLTCNTFRADPGFGPGGNVFKPTHRYGIQVKSDIQNAAGKPLAAPTGAGWVSDTFTFTTSGQKIMAAGFIDATTGFFVWLDKPEPGFEKDLAPCASTKTCPDGAGNSNLATFQKPADSSPFLVVLTEPMSDAANAALGGFKDLSGTVTLRRDDNSDPESTTVTNFAGFLGGLLFDPRVIEVYTGDTFEPGVTYHLTVPAGLQADSGDILAAGATYTFQAQGGGPAILSTAPANGAQAAAHANLAVNVKFTDTTQTPPKADNADVAVANTTRPSVEFSSPIAASDAAGTIPVGTFTLKDPAGAVVPATAAIRGGLNHQIVRLTPARTLTPGTTYTVSWTGVKAAATPASLATQTFPDGSAQFTTATFRIQLLDDPAVDTATSNTNINNQGLAIPGVQVVAVNLDRRADVPSGDLKTGNLHVLFNNTTAGVTNSSLIISEINPTTNAATPVAGTTVAPTTAGDTTNFTVTLPAAYQPKYGQKYEVRAATSITTPAAANHPLSAEGCTTGDCSDVKSFTTRKVGASIAADPSTTAATGFRVNFTDPIDPTSLTPFLTTAAKQGAFKLFSRDASGALNTTPTPINCVITSPTRVTCTTVASIGTAPTAYVASAVFLPTATQDPAQGGPSGPAIVDPATSTDPSARFSGNASGNIFAPCP